MPRLRPASRSDLSGESAFGLLVGWRLLRHGRVRPCGPGWISGLLGGSIVIGYPLCRVWAAEAGHAGGVRAAAQSAGLAGDLQGGEAVRGAPRQAEAGRQGGAPYLDSFPLVYCSHGTMQMHQIIRRQPCACASASHLAWSGARCIQRLQAHAVQKCDMSWCMRSGEEARAQAQAQYFRHRGALRSALAARDRPCPDRAQPAQCRAQPADKGPI